MKSSLEKLLPSIPFRQYLAVAFAVNLLVILAVVLLKNSLPPVVPLFYGLPRGAEQLGTRTMLALPALISTSIIVVNTILIIQIDNPFLQKVFLALIITSTALSTITVIKIIALVGSF